MRLAAINEHMAIYEEKEGESPFNAFDALQDLLSVKNYRQLIEFLKVHTRNPTFTIASTDQAYDTCIKNQPLKDKAEANKLQGNFKNAIDNYPEIDFLDKLAIKDLLKQKNHALNLSELLYFQDFLKRLLTGAAIAIGAPIPNDMFTEVSTDYVFDEQWCRMTLPCDVTETRTFVTSAELFGSDDRGIIDDEAFGDYGGILHHLDNRSGQRLTSDKTNSISQNRKSPTTPDGVIYGVWILEDLDIHAVVKLMDPTVDADSINDEDLWGSELGKKIALNADRVFFSVTAFRDDDPDEAKRMLAGRIVEQIINSVAFYDCTRLTPPTRNYSLLDMYQYEPSKGFSNANNPHPMIWFEEIYDEALKAILNNQVTLCPVCGSPVLVKDRRGRKPKEICSNTCKTIASKRRRETAIGYAMSGKPIEDAISKLGEEYASSIRRWYSEITFPYTAE